MIDIYNKNSEYFENDRKDMLKYIPQDIKTTLEIGCGSGRFSALVKEHFKVETWAIEIDKHIAEKAVERIDNVVTGEAFESLSKVPDGYFDCIILFDVLEHLIDPYTLLEVLKTKLTDSGVIVTSIPNIRYYRTFIQLVIHGNWDYKDQGILDRTHLRFFTYKSIIKMFNQANYKILKMEGIHPTSSRTYKILNTILLNAISDIRYKHFVTVAKPQ